MSSPSSVPEAELERIDEGVYPKTDGWFVVNAKETLWWHSDDFGSSTAFEGRGDAAFRQLGINLRVLQPGKPACMYHGENAQEGFLVLSGEALLLVEGQELPLEAWDFFHCPPWTEHVLVGAGSGPCVVLAVGARPEQEELLYPVEETALKHGAGVEEETNDGDVAYGRFADHQLGPSALPG